MTPAGWLRRYVAHPDPATAAVNLVAVVVAGNGPFYPLYVLALIGWDRTGAWLTMLASPVFFSVPAISRRCSRAGRVALPLIGTANTVWCAALLGGASGVEWFLLPCTVLAALVFRPAERRAGLLVTGLATLLMVVLTMWPFVGLMSLSANDAAALTRLHAISVATLTAFVSITLVNVLAETSRIANLSASQPRLAGRTPGEL
jgi:hypothetical protein